MRLTESKIADDIRRDGIKVTFAVDVKDRSVIDEQFILGKYPFNLYSEYDPVEKRRYLEACFIFDVKGYDLKVPVGKGGLYQMRGEVYPNHACTDEWLIEGSRAVNFMSFLRKSKGTTYLRIIKNDGNLEFTLNGGLY